MVYVNKAEGLLYTFAMVTRLCGLNFGFPENVENAIDFLNISIKSTKELRRSTEGQKKRKTIICWIGWCKDLNVCDDNI